MAQCLEVRHLSTDLRLHSTTSRAEAKRVRYSLLTPQITLTPTPAATSAHSGQRYDVGRPGYCSRPRCAQFSCSIRCVPGDLRTIWRCTDKHGLLPPRFSASGAEPQRSSRPFMGKYVFHASFGCRSPRIAAEIMSDPWLDWLAGWFNNMYGLLRRPPP